MKNISKNSHFIAGLVLYLAEGTKRNLGRITLTNTDPKIIRFFIDWVIKFYKFPREKFKIYLQLYPTMDLENELNFWQNELQLSSSQFYRPFIRQLRPSSFSYQGASRHGTCAAIAFGANMFEDVMMASKAFLDSTRV